MKTKDISHNNSDTSTQEHASTVGASDSSPGGPLSTNLPLPEDTTGEDKPNRSLHLSSHKFTIVATSFDGHQDLLHKYPEWVGINPKLRGLGVAVVHNVDATALDFRVLSELSVARYDHVVFNHPHTGTEDMRRHRSFLGHFFHALVTPIADSGRYEGSGVSNSSTDNEKDRGVAGIHTDGSERHGTSAAVALAPGGVVHVTLAKDQPERWGLREQAARHGFVLAHRRLFPADCIEGYMTKRHQTGKSFQRRARDSITFSFVWMGRVKEGEHWPSLCEAKCRRGAMGEVSRELEQGTRAVGTGNDFGVGNSDGGEDEGEEGRGLRTESTDDGGTYDLPPWLWPKVNIFGTELAGEQTGRAGRVQDPAAGEKLSGGDGGHDKSNGALVSGPVSAVGTRQANGGSIDDVSWSHENSNESTKGRNSRETAGNHDDRPEVCRQCGKRYKTAQALRTHTRQLHELHQKEGGFGACPEGSEPLTCLHCERVFTSRVALTQHESAKHNGAFRDIKPDWFEATIYHDCKPPSPSSSPLNKKTEAEATFSSRNASDGAQVEHNELLDRDIVHCEHLQGAAVNPGQDERFGGVSGTSSSGETCATPTRRTRGSMMLGVTGRLVEAQQVEARQVGEEPGARDEEGNGAGVLKLGSSPSSSSVHCDVCGYWFVDEAQEQRHRDNLRPPVAEEVICHECALCKKRLGSRRALLQHSNFCTKRASQPTTAR